MSRLWVGDAALLGPLGILEWTFGSACFPLFSICWFPPLALRVPRIQICWTTDHGCKGSSTHISVLAIQ